MKRNTDQKGEIGYKKLFLTSAAVLTLGVDAYSVYANSEEVIVDEHYEETNDFRPGMRGRFYEEKRDLTDEEREEEAIAWREDLAAGPRYDEENGFYRHHRNDDGHHGLNRNSHRRTGDCP